MSGIKEAKQPFQFYTKLNLLRYTGKKARNLEELLAMIKEAPESSIYHHTHNFLYTYNWVTPPPTSDFAYWVSEILHEKALAEELNSIDIIELTSISALREQIISILEKYIKASKGVRRREAMPGEEFYFTEAVTFILPTGYEANNLVEFVEALEKVSVNSLYYHIFDAGLRLHRAGENDFSFWIRDSIGDMELAYKISNADPYFYTLEELQMWIIKTVKEKIEREGIS